MAVTATHKLLVVISGPTAIGKTLLSIELAKHFNTAVISADSRQFYKEMQIGTARPTEEELQGVLHYFLGSHSIKNEINANDYEKEVLELLDKLFITQDVVLMCGGSGFYVDAVCNGFDNEIPPSDEKLKQELSSKTIEQLQIQLKELDPEYFEMVDTQNPVRLIRAIEVCLLTGKKYSELRKGTKAERPFKILKIALNQDREVLYQKINERVIKMIENGLEAEARNLMEFQHLTPLQTVGYQEFFSYFKKELSLTETIEKIQQNTRKYAKRQLTWLRRDDEYHWFAPNQVEEIKELINKSKGYFV